MRTRRFNVRDEGITAGDPAIAECAEILRRGGLVAIPTETVYGLAANALDADAVARIFAAKERPSWDPLIVHVSDFGMATRVAEAFPEKARTLAERFWPGPLTLLLKRSAQLPPDVTAGLETVAIRMPAHSVARALISATNLPLAAPSANRFGRTSPTTAEHVLQDLDGRIDAVLDAGSTSIGVESTVIDAMRTPPLLLRPGGVTREQLESVLGPIEIFSVPPGEKPESMASPGLAVRHYAPQAVLVLIDGQKDALAEAIRRHVSSEGARGDYVGVMAPQDWLDTAILERGGIVIFDWGGWENWSELAQNLFAGLRYLDKPGVSVILCPLPHEEGLGMALRDRLMRAAR